MHAKVVAFVPLLFICGCEFSCQLGGVSKDKVETSIREEIATHIDDDFKVTCPKIEKDAITSCSVEVVGGLTFAVEVKAGGGKVTYESKAVVFGKGFAPGLKREVEKTFGLMLDEVSCPPVTAAHKGAEGVCIGQASGVKVPIALRFTGGGDFDFRPVGGVVSSDKAAKLVVKQFASQNIEVKAECGPPAMRVSVPRSTFQCKATDGAGKSIPIYFKVKNASGDVDMSAQEPAKP